MGTQVDMSQKISKRVFRVYFNPMRGGDRNINLCENCFRNTEESWMWRGIKINGLCNSGQRCEHCLVVQE